MIKKTDTLGEVINSNPEIAPLLAQAGLHCIGCHVSAYESIQDGCAAHGMSEKQIDELVKQANDLAKRVDSLTKVVFTDGAIGELAARAKKAKKKFVRIMPVFGEYDFEVTDEKQVGDVEVKASALKGKVAVSVLADKRTERPLRGVRIDFDKKRKDFVAAREKK